MRPESDLIATWIVQDSAIPIDLHLGAPSPPARENKRSNPGLVAVPANALAFSFILSRFLLVYEIFKGFSSIFLGML